MAGGCSIDRSGFGAPILVMAGPTAIGKTELALTVAEKFNCEIIGVDSMQIYRYMDIGTAKPSPAELERVPHHLIDYVFPDEEFSASRFVNDCHQAIVQIRAKGRLPLLVGGTGLYFTSLEHGIFSMPAIEPTIRQELQAELGTPSGRERLFRELQACDPVSAARIHPNDTYRLLRGLEIFRATGIIWSVFIAEHQKERKATSGLTLLKIGLNREREELYRRIEHRVEVMIQAGFLAEVENLLNKGYAKSLMPMQSLGYRHMIHFLDGNWSWDKMVGLLARDTRRYAKRQLTWFRADSSIRWFHPTQIVEICTAINDFLVATKNK